MSEGRGHLRGDGTVSSEGTLQAQGPSRGRKDSQTLRAEPPNIQEGPGLWLFMAEVLPSEVLEEGGPKVGTGGDRVVIVAFICFCDTNASQSLQKLLGRVAVP